VALVFSAFDDTPLLRVDPKGVGARGVFQVRCLSLRLLNVIPFLKDIEVWKIDMEAWHIQKPPIVPTYKHCIVSPH
jgi:hypothetical protein